MNITGKTFLVTGGGSGLGEATVRTLAGAGGNVIIADINAEKGEALARELGERARFAACDVTDEASVKGAIAVAADTFGGLHGVVHCAGVGMAMRVVSKTGPHSLDVFSMVIKINLIGSFNVLRLAAAAMA
jgi:NAD(P)-dependent dehydrogenase (short-subunit alcohol dehydrogenase family)